MSAPTTDRLESGWLDDTPVEDNLVRRFLRNQGDLVEAFALAAGGRAAETHGIVLSDSGTQLPYHNQAVLQRPVLTLDDPALDAVDDFWSGEPGRMTLLFSVFPTPDLSPRGWQLMGHPMLVVRPAGPHGHTPKPGVTHETIVDADGLALGERLAIEGYPLPELAGGPEGSIVPPGLLDSPIRYRIGRLDGEPVSVAGSYVGHGVVNLCLAATLDVARRRGVWSDLVWARVDDGPDCEAVAYTSDDSRPGFVRMGFLPITRCTLWAR